MVVKVSGTSLSITSGIKFTDTHILYAFLVVGVLVMSPNTARLSAAAAAACLSKLHHHHCLFVLLCRLFDRVNLMKPVSNVRPSVRPSVHKNFLRFQ